jgi:hypothetical protein
VGKQKKEKKNFSPSEFKILFKKRTVKVQKENKILQKTINPDG